MKDSYERLFEHLEYREPPAELLDRVLLSISKKATGRALWIGALIYGFLSLVAIVAIVPSWLITQSEMHQSGFSQFLSLLLSDTNTVMVFWKEFSLSLVESFPVLGTIAILGSALLFLISMRFFVRDIIKIIHQPKFSRA